MSMALGVGRWTLLWGVALACALARTAAAAEGAAPGPTEEQRPQLTRVEPESATVTRVQVDEPEPDKQLGGSIETGIAGRRQLLLPPSPEHPRGLHRDLVSLSPMVRMDLRVRNEVELYGSAGAVVVLSQGPEGRSNVARPSNIGFGGRRVWEWGGDKYRAADFGFEFGIPTGYAETADESDAYAYALGSRGGQNPWEWMPRTLSFVAPAGIHAQIFRRWVVGGRAALAAMFPSINDVAPPTVGAQISAGARWVLPWFALGAGASAVYNGRHPTDRTQVALAPSLDTNLCRRGGRRISGTMAATTARCPVYASAKMHLNLDAPYGFFTDEAMGIWGVHVALGWSIF